MGQGEHCSLSWAHWCQLGEVGHEDLQGLGSLGGPSKAVTGAVQPQSLVSCCVLSPWAAQLGNPFVGAWIYGFSLILVRLGGLQFPFQSLQFQFPISIICFISYFWSFFIHLTGFVSHPWRELLFPDHQ